MSSKFYYQVYLPSIKDYIRISEITNQELLVIVKHNSNSDNVGLSDYLEQLILTKLHPDFSSVDLHRIDKICILLTIIMVCINPKTTLQSTCTQTQEDFSINIDIGDMLNIISNVNYDICSSTTGDITVTYRYPAELLVDTTSIHKLIYSIIIKDITYYTHDMTQSQLNDIVDNLPGNLFTSIVSSVKTMNTQFSHEKILEIKSPYVEETPRIVDMNLMNNDMLDIIFILFGSDLNGFYELQFAMMHNYNFSPQHYMDITPIESQMFYKYMKSDVAQRNEHVEQMKKDGQSPVSNITG